MDGITRDIDGYLESLRNERSTWEYYNEMPTVVNRTWEIEWRDYNSRMEIFEAAAHVWNGRHHRMDEMTDSWLEYQSTDEASLSDWFPFVGFTSRRPSVCITAPVPPTCLLRRFTLTRSTVLAASRTMVGPFTLRNFTTFNPVACLLETVRFVWILRIHSTNLVSPHYTEVQKYVTSVHGSHLRP